MLFIHENNQHSTGVDATPEFITVNGINPTPIFPASRRIIITLQDWSFQTPGLIGVIPTHAAANDMVVVVVVRSKKRKWTSNDSSQ